MLQKDEQKIITFDVDGLKLSGILHLPEQSPVALIVGVHGLMADKNSPKQIALAKRVTSIKMAYFRFDHRGCGDSEGVFNEQTTLKKQTIGPCFCDSGGSTCGGGGNPRWTFWKQPGRDDLLDHCQSSRPHLRW